jgi:hypothetical protein
MMPNISLLFLLTVLVLSPHPSTPTTSGDCESTLGRGPINAGGKCLPYSGLCKDIVGSTVFVADGESIAILDQRVIDSVNTARKQSAGLLSDDCTKATEEFTCRNHLYQCTTDPVTGEGLPILLCKDECIRYWDTCNVGPIFPFDTYADSLVAPGGDGLVKAQVPFCNETGSFHKYPQPADTYGGRDVYPFPTYAIGLKGVDRYPTNDYPYNTSKGKIVTLQCTGITQTQRDADHIVLPAPECSAPLILNGDQCSAPCPYPVMTVTQLNGIGIAFYVPGIIGVVACVLVLIDVIMQVIGLIDFHHVKGQVTKLFSQNSSSAAENTSAGAGGSSAASEKARQRAAKRAQLRASTSYAFIASVLGIIFFLVGPLGTLTKGSKVSCPADFPPGIFDGAAVYNGEDYSDSVCKAQRVSPFILQWLFNLILYALARVFWVVDDRAKRMPEQSKMILTWILRFYCFCVPAIFLGVALGLDGYSIDLLPSQVEWARQAAICWPRFNIKDPSQNSAAEFILIFLPYIITGVAVVILAGLSFRTLSIVRQKTKNLIGTAQTSSSTKALLQLISRLAVLGLLTLIDLIILIITTSVSIAQTQNWVTVFSEFYVCNQTCPCGGRCGRCQAPKAAMAANTPNPAIMGLQVVCMSNITVLVGFFFLSQAVSRIQRDLRDGKTYCGMKASGSSARVDGNTTSNQGGASSPSFHKKDVTEIFSSTAPTTFEHNKNDTQVAAYMSGT